MERHNRREIPTNKDLTAAAEVPKNEVEETLDDVVSVFDDKWPGVKLINIDGKLAIRLSGPNITHELEDEVYASVEGHLKKLGYELDQGSHSGGWSGDTYGNEDFEQGDRFGLKQLD